MSTKTKLNYENLLGFSCVENQVLAILRESGMDIIHFYCDCAVQFNDLIIETILNNTKAENYYGIQRIQDKVKYMGIIDMKKFIMSGYELLSYFKCRNDVSVLIKIIPEATKSLFHARGFRNDHYVLMRMDGSEIILYNDIPAVNVKIDFDSLMDIYAGEAIVIEILRPLIIKDIKDMFNERRNKPVKKEDFNISSSDLKKMCKSKNIENLGDKFSHLLRIYKILRSRMAVYYGYYFPVDFISIDEIKKIQSLIEYCNLKDSNDFNKRFELYDKLIEYDNKIMKLCTENLEVL